MVKLFKILFDSVLIFIFLCTGYFNETQIICNLLSVDGVNDPEVLAINAASAALAVSDIPWNGPIAAVRVGLIDNETVINPTRKQMGSSKLNLMVSAARKDLVVMLEASAENVYLQDFKGAIKTGVKECQSIIRAIEEVKALSGKPKREFSLLPAAPSELTDALQIMCENRLRSILQDFSHDKVSRDIAIAAVRNQVVEELKNSFSTIDHLVISESFNKFYKKLFRQLIIDTEIR